MKMITWDRPMLNRFKLAYQSAKLQKLRQFDFEGNSYLIDYAKYLIEYLNETIGNPATLN